MKIKNGIKIIGLLAILFMLVSDCCCGCKCTDKDIDIDIE